MNTVKAVQINSKMDNEAYKLSHLLQIQLRFDLNADALDHAMDLETMLARMFIGVNNRVVGQGTENQVPSKAIESKLNEYQQEISKQLSDISVQFQLNFFGQRFQTLLSLITAMGSTLDDDLTQSIAFYIRANAEQFSRYQLIFMSINLQNPIENYQNTMELIKLETNRFADKTSANMTAYRKFNDDFNIDMVNYEKHKIDQWKYFQLLDRVMDDLNENFENFTGKLYAIVESERILFDQQTVTSPIVSDRFPTDEFIYTIETLWTKSNKPEWYRLIRCIRNVHRLCINIEFNLKKIDMDFNTDMNHINYIKSIDIPEKRIQIPPKEKIDKILNDIKEFRLHLNSKLVSIQELCSGVKFENLLRLIRRLANHSLIFILEDEVSKIAKITGEIAECYSKVEFLRTKFDAKNHLSDIVLKWKNDLDRLQWHKSIKDAAKDTNDFIGKTLMEKLKNSFNDIIDLSQLATETSKKMIKIQDDLITDLIEQFGVRSIGYNNSFIDWINSKINPITRDLTPPQKIKHVFLECIKTIINFNIDIGQMVEAVKIALDANYFGEINPIQTELQSVINLNTSQGKQINFKQMPTPRILNGIKQNIQDFTNEIDELFNAFSQITSKQMLDNLKLSIEYALERNVDQKCFEAAQHLANKVKSYHKILLILFTKFSTRTFGMEMLKLHIELDRIRYHPNADEEMFLNAEYNVEKTIFGALMNEYRENGKHLLQIRRIAQKVELIQTQCFSLFNDRRGHHPTFKLFLTENELDRLASNKMHMDMRVFVGADLFAMALIKQPSPDYLFDDFFVIDIDVPELVPIEMNYPESPVSIHFTYLTTDPVNGRLAIRIRTSDFYTTRNLRPRTNYKTPVRTESYCSWIESRSNRSNIRRSQQTITTIVLQPSIRRNVRDAENKLEIPEFTNGEDKPEVPDEYDNPNTIAILARPNNPHLPSIWLPDKKNPIKNKVTDLLYGIKLTFDNENVVTAVQSEAKPKRPSLAKRLASKICRK